MNKNYQRTCTHFLAKYGGLSISDINCGKKYSIDDGDIHFLKGGVYALIGNPDHPYLTSTDHEFFAFMMTCST